MALWRRVPKRFGSFRDAPRRGANSHDGRLCEIHGCALAEDPTPNSASARIYRPDRAPSRYTVDAVRSAWGDADGDDGRVRQNLARHAVDLRFQRLVKRRRHLTEEQPIRLSRIARAIARRCRSSPEKALGPVVLVVNLAGNRRAAVWCQAPRLVDQRTGKSPFCHARAPPKPPIRRSPWSFVTK